MQTILFVISNTKKMKKGVMIAVVALATSLAVYAGFENDKKTEVKEQKECCEPTKDCCEVKPDCCTKK
ncbi:MAG: hypothetical protein EAZ97_13320 [Bacteroidetes bacterium]|nr:MAG: hypothetical protein EAZ97_13320 [Bacteroidota bacterium]